MSISASTIQTRVEDITKRGFTSVSQIQNELMDILLDLSLQGPFLATSTIGTVAANAQYFEKPSDCGYIDSVHFSGLILNEGLLDDILLRQRDGFAVKNNQIFICPVSESNRSYTLYYGKKHSSLITSIEFTDEFLGAIVHGVAWKVYGRFSIYDKSAAQYELYKQEIERHLKRLRIGA